MAGYLGIGGLFCDPTKSYQIAPKGGVFSVPQSHVTGGMQDLRIRPRLFALGLERENICIVAMRIHGVTCSPEKSSI